MPDFSSLVFPAGLALVAYGYFSGSRLAKLFGVGLASFALVKRFPLLPQIPGALRATPAPTVAPPGGLMSKVVHAQYIPSGGQVPGMLT